MQGGCDAPGRVAGGVAGKDVEFVVAHSTTRSASVWARGRAAKERAAHPRAACPRCCRSRTGSTPTPPRRRRLRPRACSGRPPAPRTRRPWPIPRRHPLAFHAVRKAHEARRAKLGCRERLCRLSGGAGAGRGTCPVLRSPLVVYRVSKRRFRTYLHTRCADSRPKKNDLRTAGWHGTDTVTTTVTDL